MNLRRGKIGPCTATRVPGANQTASPASPSDRPSMSSFSFTDVCAAVEKSGSCRFRTLARVSSSRGTRILTTQLQGCATMHQVAGMRDHAPGC